MRNKEHQHIIRVIQLKKLGSIQKVVAYIQEVYYKHRATDNKLLYDLDSQLAEISLHEKQYHKWLKRQSTYDYQEYKDLFRNSMNWLLNIKERQQKQDSLKEKKERFKKLKMA
jgi:hypothetical protein